MTIPPLGLEVGDTVKLDGVDATVAGSDPGWITVTYPDTNGNEAKLTLAPHEYGRLESSR